MTRLRDPESNALAQLVKILVDPAAAKAAFEKFMIQRASINLMRVELEMVEQQLADRERQCAVREENIRKREAALEAVTDASH
jgi:hypothetical protein